MQARWIFASWAALALSGCASLSPAVPAPAPAATTAEPCQAERIDSAPGRVWWQSQRWRHASDEAALAAYRALVVGQSPWPDWFVPSESLLPVGTRLQMAIGGAQTPDQPGGFATFDNIASDADVRDGLAVIRAWKPAVDRVVIYETLRDMPVRIGPVGPQVDAGTCRLLSGRWSQVQMMVPAAERMAYLRVVEVHPLP
jgi:hypothetical protein